MGMGSAEREKLPRIVGRYTLYAPIASGGMATVYFGRLSGAAGFSRTVAIKRMNDLTSSITELAASLADEARITSRIRHSHVVPTLDVVTDGDALLLVMEYVEGETLARLARAAGRVAWPVAVAIVIGVLRGLHAAHEATSERGKPLGIIHRDVSPQNILVGVDGVARVADFGIAKAQGRLQSTQQGTVKGKIAYLSPEQTRGDPDQDRRVDVWATSVVLWEAITGKRLFAVGDILATAMAVLEGPITPPSTHVVELPAALDAIVMKGLARDKAERWSSAKEMADALEATATVAPMSEIAEWVRTHATDALAYRTGCLAEIEALSGVAPIVSSPAPDRSTPAPSATLTIGAPPRASSRGRVGAIVALVVVGVVVASWSLSRSAPEPTPEGRSAAIDDGVPPSVELPNAPTTGVASAAPPLTETASAAPPPAKRTRAIRKGGSAGAGAVNCDTPFTVDSAGIKIPRRECLP